MEGDHQGHIYHSNHGATRIKGGSTNKAKDAQLEKLHRSLIPGVHKSHWYDDCYAAGLDTGLGATSLFPTHLLSPANGPPECDHARY